MMDLEDQLPDESPSLFHSSPSDDECDEAFALMKHSADEDTIKKKMKLTFDFRHNVVVDPQQSSNILSVFLQLKNVKCLVINFHYFDSEVLLKKMRERKSVYFSDCKPLI